MDFKNILETVKTQADGLKKKIPALFAKKKSPAEIEADFEEVMHKVDTFETRVEIPREKAKAKMAEKKTQGIVKKAMEASNNEE